MIHLFGTVCIDRIRRVEKLPPIGGYAEVQEEMELLGGEAANTAACLALWDVPVELYSNAIGIGERSDRLAYKLEAAGLSVSHLVKSGEVQTPICDIYVTPDGERTMFGLGFVQMDRHVDIPVFESQPSAWFSCEPNMPEAAFETAQRALSKGHQVYLMDFPPGDLPVGEGGFWQSSTDLFGTKGNTQKNVQWLGRFVHDHRCFAVLSDGPNGFIAGSPTMPVRHYPPFPAPHIVDMTGAGDLFRAGMLYGLHQGLPLSDCLRIASAVGCLSVGKIGGANSAPSLQAVLDHVKANPDVARSYN